MHCLRIASLALLLPVSAAVAGTNLLDLAFSEARLIEVAEVLTEATGIKLLVAENYADVPVSIELKQATPQDALALIALRHVCDGTHLGWKESALTDGQKAHVLVEAPPPSTRPLADVARQFKALARTNMNFRQAALADVAKFLQKQSGGALTLIHGANSAEIPVDLKLKDVNVIDALLSMNELFAAGGSSMAWRAVELPSGRMALALLDVAAPLGSDGTAVTPGTARVYYVGDLGGDPAETVDSVRQLMETARLEADINFHEATRMLVVRGGDEEHEFVRNVVEELRRGAGKANQDVETK